MEIGPSIFDSLTGILDNLVVKFGVEAQSMETATSRLDYEYYKMSVEETDTIRTYKQYPIDVVRAANITTIEKLIELYASTPDNIPDNLKEKVLIENRKYVIENFEEKNNYYRKLIGKPEVNDLDFFYVPDDIAETHNISRLTPIHLLSDIDIVILTSIGYIDELIKENPNKGYLGFLGANRINLINARDALNFDLLRVDKTVDKVIYESFVTTYTKARNYFGKVIFNSQIAKQVKHYEGFMGITLLIASLQQMTAFSYKNNIYREFFDLSTIKVFFDCYKLPFFKAVPLERQRLLVKNINKLLYYKSTNKAIYDLCSLMGYESINIYQYYLVKRHNIDENGIPLFPTITNDDGVEVPDYERMYTLFFQPIDIKDENPALSFINSESRIPYNEVTTVDPYWYEDDSTKKAIYESDFNFTETKYLSINTTYRLTKMIFEVCHFYRIISDNKRYTNLMAIELPKLFSDEKFTFFDVTIFSLGLISKRMGYNGEIPDTTTKVMSIMGFNFKKDYKTIEKLINEDVNLLKHAKTLKKYTLTKPLGTPLDINTLYSNIKSLSTYIKNQLRKTDNLDEYRALKKFYKAVLVMDDSNSMYKLKDGTIAPTVIDYLEEYSPLLGSFLRNTDDMTELNLALSHVITRFQAMLDELKYLSIITDENSETLSALIQLIRFFKSYTVDVTSYSVMYLLDDHDSQSVRILDDMEEVIMNMGLDDYSYGILYTDFVSIKSALKTRDKIVTNQNYDYDAVINTKDSARLVSMMKNIKAVMGIQSSIYKTAYKDDLFINALQNLDCVMATTKEQIRENIVISTKDNMVQDSDIKYDMFSHHREGVDIYEHIATTMNDRINDRSVIMRDKLYKD